MMPIEQLETNKEMTLNRRTFVKLGALSSVVFGTNARGAFALQDAPIRPMASQAKPITREEYLQRQENARRYMRDGGIDAILLTGGTSLQYFTGAQWGLSERLFALVFPAKGELGWVAPAFEKGRALEQIKFGDDVRTWQEDESPYQLVASILKDRSVVSGKLGVEETVRFVFSDGVAKAAPAIKLTSADSVTSRCRRIKSAHEIELMRLANQITLKAFEIALKSLKEGMTQTELAGKVAATHQQLGARGGALVLFGKDSACEDVDAAARKVITDAGYGPDYKNFTHRVGHGIGMDGHEWTYLVRGNKMRLEAGMTFSDEPGIYIPEEFGMRCEDIMVITKDGSELLTGPAHSLEHPFG